MSEYEYDVVIVGSGVAATAIAHAILSQRPSTKVIMLEAGDRIKQKNYALFESYLTTGKLPEDSETIYDSYGDLGYPEKDIDRENKFLGNNEIHLKGSRLFAFGGSTTHWGGWCFRMKKEDFHLGTIHQDSSGFSSIDWPISYNVVEQYYPKAERFIGVSGALPDHPFKEFPFTKEDGQIIKALQVAIPAEANHGCRYEHLPIARYGVAENPENPSTRPPCQTTGTCKYCPFGSKFTAANRLDEMKAQSKFENLTIRLNAIVTRILVNDQSASGLEYIDKWDPSVIGQNGRRERKTKTILGKFIVVAAGAIESTKLLLATNFKKRIGHLGKHFVTHPYFSFSGTLPSAELSYQRQMGFPTLVSRHFDSEVEQREGKFILLHAVNSPKLDFSDEMGAGKSIEQIQVNLKQRVRFQLDGMVEVFSKQKNTIAIHRGTNRFGLPQTELHYTRDKNFGMRMNYIEEKVKEIFRAMGATEVKRDKVHWRADHAACTARMSADPRDGVVDSNLEVHSCTKLFVCSNASLPNIGAVNPTLTLVALSLRLGDHLLNKLNAV